MTTITAKPKTGKSIWEMDKEDMENAFAETTKQAQQEIHDKGFPYIIGDKAGIYSVYPDGKRVFTSYERLRNNEG